jgi:hypothetical protein
VESKKVRMRRVKQWEIIADNVSKSGFSLGWVSALDAQGRTIWIVDAHGYGKRFIVRADEMLTPFVELQRAIHEFAVSLISSYPRRRKANCVSGTRTGARLALEM